MGINILSENGEKLMVKKKSYDGVVVAARYTHQGKIDWVRAFERHGFVFSDRLMMDRQTLVEHLREGKRFKTGERMAYQGNDFKVIADIRLIEKDGDSVIVAGETSSNQDTLGNLPII
jgi:hypothetical protein